MRLFSAVWPSAEAVAHLDAALRQVELPDGVRRVPSTKWHLTLAFHGDDADLTKRTRRLDKRVAGLRGATMRLAGAGSFPGVLWVGVEPATDEDAAALQALATAAGAERERRYRPHVTVARWRLRRADRALAERLADYRGPQWTATEVTLVHSRQGADYLGVHSVPLITW